MGTGKGVILFGHGSRDPLWRLPIESVAARVRAQNPGATVRCAYLELDTPGLAAAAQGLVADGIGSITVVPMFLGTGRHAREDLPGLVDAVRRAHPGLEIVLQKPVGEDSRVVDLLAKIALE
jgi:sirohydrochlorin cobaltochelatase